MTVGGSFVYVCVKDFEQWSRVYNAVRYNTVIITQSVIKRVFSRGPRRPRYNGVAVYH